jgi:hypothetical protein
MGLDPNTEAARNNERVGIHLADADLAVTLPDSIRSLFAKITSATSRTTALPDPSLMLDKIVRVYFQKTSTGELSISGVGITTVVLNGDGDEAAFHSDGYTWMTLVAQT